MTTVFVFTLSEETSAQKPGDIGPAWNRLSVESV